MAITNKYLILSEYVKIYITKNNKLYIAKIDIKDFEMLETSFSKDIKLCINEYKTNMYVKFYQNNKSYSLHRVIMCPPQNKLIDHINRNGLDNRRCNLRICTKEINNQNRSLSCNNNSGENGVYFAKDKNKWCSSIHLNNKRQHLGFYDTLNDAIRVRKLAEKWLWNNSKTR